MSNSEKQLTASRYLHLIDSPGGAIAFNSLTLESFDLTESEHEILTRIIGKQSIERSKAEHFLKAGLVVENEEPQNLALEKLAATRRSRRHHVRSHFSMLRLALTERCNMACSYCFQQQLYPENQPTISRENLIEVMNWFITQGENQTLTVQYFGGEPMLEWDNLVHAHNMLEEASRAGIIEGFHESMTTNGTLITQERASWMVESGFDLTFSFDGPPPINDEHRKLRSGRGTYELAARGLKVWTECGGEPAILLTATEDSVKNLPEYVRWFVEDSGLEPRVIGLNSPQPTQLGWETGGEELADSVWAIWNYCNENDVAFHGPGTFIPQHLKHFTPQADTCVDLKTGDAPSWPIYVNARGESSLCLVHHQDHRVTVEKRQALKEKAVNWHNQSKSVSEVCDGCIASQVCGGPCTLERILWGDRLSNDRCAFMQKMTKLVLTEG